MPGRKHIPSRVVVSVLLAGLLRAAAPAVGVTESVAAPVDVASAEAAGMAAGAGDGIRIDTAVTADSVTVGERLRVNYRASYPESLVLLPPESFDTGTCRLVSLTWRNDKAKGKRVKEARLTVMTVDLEEARVPEPSFHFLTPRGDTLIAYGEEVSVPVRGLTRAQDEAKPLKPQWQAPRSFSYLYMVAAGLVLAALAVFLWKRRRRAVTEVPPEPVIPADILAMEILSRIEKMDLLESGEFKRYYTLVVDAIRHYLERRFGVQAMDRTTHEILVDLDVIRVRIAELEPLLREADLVKFAKFQADTAAGKRAMDRAREIVVQTALPQQEPEQPVPPESLRRLPTEPAKPLSQESAKPVPPGSAKPPPPGSIH